MAISLKHSFTSPKADGVDSTLVQPSNWNAEHTITLAAGKVLGRDTSAAGAMQELPLAFDTSGNASLSATGFFTTAVGTTAQRPGVPVTGMFRFNSSLSKFEGYNGSAWSPVGGGGATISDTAPASPSAGDLWWNSSNGQMYTYYNDGTSSQWVVANSFTGGSAYLPLTGGTVSGNLTVAGNVGIGTSSPQKKFVVSNSGAVGMEWSPTDYTGNMRQLAYNRNTSAYVALRTEASQHELYIGGTEAVRIDTSGNVGIGTSSPASKLEIYSTANSYTATRVTSNSGTAYVELYANPVAGLTGLASSSTNPMAFNVNGVERGRFAANGDFWFNSGYGNPAVAYGCRAWLNYNLSTQTTRASANVSSVTYNSTGYFTINFTNSMPDANYAIAGMGEWTSGSTAQTYPFVRNTTPPTTTNCPIVVSSNGFQNPTWLTIMIVR
jgi:hypothetical protein